jgi:plastocyanin
LKKREHLEIILSLTAVIASSVAAIGAFFTGFYQMQAVNLERIPAIHLACRPEYRLAEQAAHVDQPEETLLLRPSGGEWLHIGGTSETEEAEARVGVPEPFARCTIKNFGRLPLLDVDVPTLLTFTLPKTGATVRSSFELDLPGLSADAAYDFSLLNGSGGSMRIAFERTIRVAAIDASGGAPQHLFVDAGVEELERMQIASANRDEGMDMRPHAETRVIISDFTFRPAAIHVRRGALVTFMNADEEAHTVTSVDRTFDSGTIDPGRRWMHTFDRAGHYVFRCRYHPYMRGEVDVR